MELDDWVSWEGECMRTLSESVVGSDIVVDVEGMTNVAEEERMKATGWMSRECRPR